MAKSWNKATFLIVVFAVCFACVILSGVAFGTRDWITQNATVETKIDENTTMLQQVNLNAGLFQIDTQKTKPVLLPYTYSLRDEYNKNPNLMNFGLWVTTIACLALSMVFGITVAVFAALNSVMTPIEEITGITGLYLWDGLACLFSLLTVLLYIGQYCNYLVHILESMQDTLTLTTADNLNQPSSLGYSFYLVCGATGLYIVNNLFIYLSSIKIGPMLPPSGKHDEPADGMIMLY